MRPLPLLSLVACGGPDEVPRGPGPRPPAPEPAPIEPAPIDVTLMTWSAEFGWDGAPVPIDTAYGLVEPRIVVTLADARWEEVGFDLGRPDLYCTIELPLTAPAPLGWLDDPTLWDGVAWAGEAPGGTCGDAGHPVGASPWGPDPVAALATGEWGVAVGELSPDALGLLGYYPETLAWALGGRFLLGPLPPDDAVFGLAWALDADGALLLDEAGAVSHVAPDGALARAGYWFDALFIYPAGG